MSSAEPARSPAQKRRLSRPTANRKRSLSPPVLPEWARQKHRRQASEDGDAQNLAFESDLAPEQVVYVDDAPSRERAAAILREAAVVGLDSEWRPGKNSTVALIQLACRSRAGEEKVLLLDCIRLRPDELGELLRPTLRSEDVVVLGHGLKGDLKELNRSFAGAGLYLMTGVLEVGKMAALAEEQKASHAGAGEEVGGEKQAAEESAPPSPSRGVRPPAGPRPSPRPSPSGWQGSSCRSLKSLTLKYLDSTLDKKYQCSDWTLRPLRRGQLRYAVADALVLLRLHDAIRALIRDVQPDYTHDALLERYTLTPN